jgi:hypothetical protein
MAMEEMKLKMQEGVESFVDGGSPFTGAVVEGLRVHSHVSCSWGLR